VKSGYRVYTSKKTFLIGKRGKWINFQDFETYERALEFSRGLVEDSFCEIKFFDSAETLYEFYLAHGRHPRIEPLGHSPAPSVVFCHLDYAKQYAERLANRPEGLEARRMELAEVAVKEMGYFELTPGVIAKVVKKKRIIFWP